MARGVHVDITDRAIITALNTKGGAVSNWSEATGRRIKMKAESLTPVNNVNNALHRGGEVGEMKRSWKRDGIGTNGHHVRQTVYNTARHSYWIEYGRNRSHSFEVFTWEHAYIWDDIEGQIGHMDPGGMIFAKKGTKGYPAQAPLHRAVNMVMPGRTNGRYTPLAHSS